MAGSGPDLLGLDVAGRHGAADTEHAEPVHIAEIVLHLLELGHRLERDLHAAALDLDLERRAGADADDALHVGEAVDRLAVDGEHEVAGLEAGGLRRAVRLHGIDAGGRGLLADDHENARRK